MGDGRRRFVGVDWFWSYFFWVLETNWRFGGYFFRLVLESFCLFVLVSEKKPGGWFCFFLGLLGCGGVFLFCFGKTGG